jgi:hypothetical protein
MLNKQLNLIFETSLDCNAKRGFDLPILLSDIDKKKLIKKVKNIISRDEIYSCLFYSDEKKDFQSYNVKINRKDIMYWICFFTLKEHEMSFEYTKEYLKQRYS